MTAADCPHDEFHSEVKVYVRRPELHLAMPDGMLLPSFFIATVTTKCVRCGVLFEFVGVPEPNPDCAVAPFTDKTGTVLTVVLRPTLERESA